MKTYSRVMPQQRWFKPSVSTGIKGAQYASMLGCRYAGARGMVVGGALGFLVGSVIGGALDELDAL